MPIALQFTRKAKTRLAFAAALTFVLSVVSIAMIPLAIEVLPEAVQRNQQPILMLVASIALYIALPLVVGVWAAKRLPTIASRLVGPLRLLASVVFFFLMWETRLVRAEAFNEDPRRRIRAGDGPVAGALDVDRVADRRVRP